MADARAQKDVCSFVPHERSHGITTMLENVCMLLPKALKMRAIKDTMALVADSIGGTKCASAQMSWYLGHPNTALLNWQVMSTHPNMENGPELCHRKGQLIVGLCVNLSSRDFGILHVTTCSCNPQHNMAPVAVIG